MKLYFLRHGKAEERSPSGSDAARRLTSAGIAEMKAEAAGMAALEVAFDRILTSPLPRARETAEIVAEALGKAAGEFQVAEALAAGGFGIGALQELLEQESGDSRLLLVGHEPDFSMIVGRLTGASIELKKGGLALVETARIEPDGGVLRWLLTPRILMLVGREGDQLPE